MIVNHHIPFEKIEWESPAPGVYQKSITQKGQRLRLLKFEDNFEEIDWCTQGHVGYVLDGEMTIDFNGRTIQYKQGDALWIPSGEAHKHKAKISKGKFVLLILFERIEH